MKFEKPFSNSRSKDTAMIPDAEGVGDDFIVSLDGTIFRISTGTGLLKVQNVNTGYYSNVCLGTQKVIELEETVCQNQLVCMVRPIGQ